MSNLLNENGFKLNKFYNLVIILGLMVIVFLMQGCSHSLELKDAKQFDIKSEPQKVLHETSVKDDTVLQSFAFDNVNGHIYVLQVMGGGQKLADEEVLASWDKRSLQGDLTLTKLDLEGNQLGYMHLKGFGHGVSMGIEMEGKEPYIWMETDAIDDGTSGWGNKLTRLSFEDGALINAESDDLEKYEPIPGATNTTVNIDQAYELLTMRYRLDGAFRYAVYPLEDFKEGIYEPIYDVAQPKDIDTFQGFASYGYYLYLLEGNEFKEDDQKGNTYITTIDLEDEEVLDKQFIDAALDLPFREPEGMAIAIPNPKKPHIATLNFGFASTYSGFNSKLINIYRFETFLD